MLTGHAVSNVFNGTQELDSGGKEKVPWHFSFQYAMVHYLEMIESKNKI